VAIQGDSKGYNRPKLMYTVCMSLLKDLTGQRFTRLIVLSLASLRPVKWNCVCDCGNSKVSTSSGLQRGDTRSCGCLHLEWCQTGNQSRKHGGKGTTEYKIWSGIKSRCLTPSDRAFHLYGGRGVTICDRWRDSFPKFLEDMGNRPSPAHTINRVDNDGPYSPDNCRWATWEEQNNNQRCNHYITHQGQTRTMAQWARDLGLNYNTFRGAIYAGESIESVIARMA
jgi:hypothetical protein